MYKYTHVCRLKLEFNERISKHFREPFTNYQLFPCWFTAIKNGFRNFCFIFECILRNCQLRSHKAFQSNEPIGRKDSAKENAPDPLTGWENGKYNSSSENHIKSYKHILCRPSTIHLCQPPLLPGPLRTRGLFVSSMICFSLYNL